MDKLYAVINDNTKKCLFLMVIHTSYNDAKNFINKMCLKHNIDPEKFRITPMDVGTIYKIEHGSSIIKNEMKNNIIPFNNKEGN